MTKAPYGGFDARFEYLDPDPWVNLDTIQEFLEDGEPLPPDLAKWLGLAIRHSNRDTGEFMRRLGLNSGRGNPNGHPVNVRLEWGERVCRLEDGGLSPGDALDKALLKFAEQAGDETVSRETLKNWRDLYRKNR